MRAKRAGWWRANHASGLKLNLAARAPYTRKERQVSLDTFKFRAIYPKYTFGCKRLVADEPRPNPVRHGAGVAYGQWKFQSPILTRRDEVFAWKAMKFFVRRLGLYLFRQKAAVSLGFVPNPSFGVFC